MARTAAPSSPLLIPVRGGATSVPAALKLGLRARPSSPRLDEFAGLEHLDREELDEDYAPPSRQRVA
jgi:hypothetical protein